MYTVEVEENESSNRLNLHGCYILKLYDDGFHLLDKETENVLYSWPVAVLRRYGSSNSKFSFESGRRSQTGVEYLIFLTPFCKRIHQFFYNMTHHEKSQRITDLQNRVDSLESRITEIHDRVPKQDIKTQYINSNTNKTSDQISGEGLKEEKQNERVDYSVRDRGECRYPRNLHNSKVVKELVREIQKPNEAMGYTRNQDNSKNLKIENDVYEG